MKQITALAIMLACVSAQAWNLQLVEVLEVHDSGVEGGYGHGGNYAMGTNLIQSGRLKDPPFGGYWQAPAPRESCYGETARVRYVPRPEQMAPRTKTVKTGIYQQHLDGHGIWLTERHVEYYEYVDYAGLVNLTYYPTEIRQSVYIEYQTDDAPVNILLQGTAYSLPPNSSGWLPVYSHPEYQDRSKQFEILLPNGEERAPVYVRDVVYKKEFISVVLL